MAARKHVDTCRSMIPNPALKGAISRGWTLFGDKKEMKEDDDPIGTAMSAVASVFTSPNVTYTFRLVSTGTISSSNTLNTSVAITWDPTLLSEYSTYLIFLFNEVRIRSATLHLTGLNPASGNDYAYVLSSDLGFTSSAPASLSAILDNPNSRIISDYAAKGPVIQSLHVKVPGDYLWASVLTPVPALNTGCYGQFQLFSMSSAVNSSTRFQWICELEYEFRSRT